jgi:hypothetical protein
MFICSAANAGLFSAVATSFIIQAYQSTQTDYTQVTALLLSVVVREQFNNSALIPTIPSHESLLPTSTDYLLIVNRLWYSSLILSLSTALFGILAKQWLVAYRLPSKARSPKEWAQWRQFRFAGFERWQVPLIISILPFLLHLSLLLFAVGLALFLHPFDRISWVITVAFLAIASAMYLLATFLPVVIPDCPYRTRLFEFVRDYATIVLSFIQSCMPVEDSDSFLPISAIARPYGFELSRVAAQSNALTARALSWLGTTSPLNEVFMAVLRAVGAAVPGEQLTTDFRQCGIDTLITESLRLRHIDWRRDNPYLKRAPIAVEVKPLMILYLRALINCTEHRGIGASSQLSAITWMARGMSLNLRWVYPGRFDVDNWKAQLGCSIALPLIADTRISDEGIMAILSIVVKVNSGLLRHLHSTEAEWSIVRSCHLFHVLSVTEMEPQAEEDLTIIGLELIIKLLHAHCTNIAPLLPHISEVTSAVERVQAQTNTYPLHLKWDTSGS